MTATTIPCPGRGLFRTFLNPSGVVVKVAPWSSEINMAPFDAQEWNTTDGNVELVRIGRV
jgi:hypothetical protein